MKTTDVKSKPGPNAGDSGIFSARQEIRIEFLPSLGEAVPAVNLRELHQALGSRRDYSHWSTARLRDSMAKEAIHFVIDKFVANGRSGKKTIRHFVVFDIAKHIAMLERNEKGFQIREYFIRIEKEFRKLQLEELEKRNDDCRARLEETERHKELLMFRLSVALECMALVLPIHPLGSVTSGGRTRTSLRRASITTGRAAKKTHLF